MPLIIDSHCDLAWNMLNFGRDYTRSAAETREKEKGTLAPEKNGASLIGWPDYQRGQVAIVFSTLFAAPARIKRRRLGQALLYDLSAKPISCILTSCIFIINWPKPSLIISA